MNENTDPKTTIISFYEKIVKEKLRLPTYSDFIDWDISRDKIRNSFGNLTKLHSYIEDNHRNIIDENLAHEDNIFSKKKLQELHSDLKNYKRFFVTTAVSYKEVDENFYNSIKNFCARNEALLLILPCADVASTNTKTKLTFRNILKDEYFIHQETKLNDKIFLSNIKISAKQIVPTTGLSRIGQRNGSYIFASPKQSLEFVATSAQKDRSPMALMTPGCLTVPNYQSERYMSERTSYIAENDHVMGGVIVEIADRKKFHFRQVQANHKGEFVDLSTRYKPNGEIEKNIQAHLYAGDWHSGQTDKHIFKGLSKLFDNLPIYDFITGDFFDGYSISHHTINVPLKRVKRHMESKSSLVNELASGAEDMNWILNNISGSLVMVKGNHDEVLEKYLMNANYIKDDINHYDSLDLAKLYLEGKNVLKEAYRKHTDIQEFDRIIWLERDEEYKIANVECGQHGDKGANGSKASLLSIEKAYGNCVVGHTHSAAILRGVFRVGTYSILDLDYVSGPSSWTQTGCLVYDDGSRQLINFINGDFTTLF